MEDVAIHRHLHTLVLQSTKYKDTRLRKQASVFQSQVPKESKQNQKALALIGLLVRGLGGVLLLLLLTGTLTPQGASP